jgi:hypothetical protein
MARVVKAEDRLTFRGCMWDAHWEFDAPCVVYSPVKRYGFGGNSGEIDHMVDSVCCDIALGKLTWSGWHESDVREFKWRGWWRWGFRWRRRAWHVVIVVEFYRSGDGLLWRVVSRKERYGLWGKWEVSE